MTRDYRLRAKKAAPREVVRLLFAEHHLQHLDDVCAHLGGMEFDVTTADCGEAALDRIAQERFDVIGLDINLPDMDGLAVLRAVRGRGDETPIVFITGVNDAAIAVEGLKAGAEDFIVKSGDPAYLDLLGNALRQAHKSAVGERARARAESSRDVLMRELAHRVKNQLAVVSSIATSSGRRATDVQSFVRDFGARIQAISAAYDLLFKSDWQPVAIDALVDAILAVSTRGDRHIRIDLPPLKIDAQTTQAFGMALHELADNALCHGALAHGGDLALRADIDLTEEGQFFVLEWTETSPVAAVEPTRRGYGLSMIHNVLGQLGGEAHFAWRDTGLQARLVFKISAFG